METNNNAEKKGTHWRKYRNEKYLGSWDFQPNKEYPFLIDKVQKEDIVSRGGTDTRPVIYTKTSPKGIVCNVENCLIIESMYGSEVENWVGKTVIVTIKQVKLRSGMVWGIRLLNRVQA